MAGFSFKMIQKGTQKKARKVILYGPPKLGKSTLAGSTKGALLIPTEDRVAHIACDKSPLVEEYWQMIEIFDWLLSKENLSYKRVIIDTIDWLEPIIHKHVCEKNKWSSLTDDHNKETAFSKGLKYHAVAAWREFLAKCDDLRDAGIDVILVSHAQIVKVNLPDLDEYDKYVMKIDKNALPVLEEWTDVIAFYNKDIIVRKGEGLNAKKGKALATNTRTLHLTGESASMISGNSFGLEDIEVEVDACTKIMEYILTGPFPEKTKTTGGQ